VYGAIGVGQGAGYQDSSFLFIHGADIFACLGGPLIRAQK
jgi:hypothetical protein